MERPCKGSTREQLLEIFHDRVFYHLRIYNNNYIIRPCILDANGSWHPDTPYVVFFDVDKDWKLEPFTNAVGWERLFDSWEEAQRHYKHLDRLYNKGFWQKPFVEPHILEKYKGEMIRIEKLINEGLKDYPNFLGIDFCDVHANGIQIRGHHKEVARYIFGSQPTIYYDFTNKSEVIDEFLEMWKQNDTPEEVKRFKQFIADGEKYGWD